MRKQNQDMKEKFYASLYKIRKTEEEIIRIYPSDKIKSPVHLSIGQEAVSVGVCQALRSSDAVFGTYRSHALYIAKGANLKEMFAELFAKASGSTKGKGGSMHLTAIKNFLMPTSAIVGTTIPHAVGFAYGLKYKRSDSLAVSFFGDGAVDEGAFHESLNFAALKRLPVLFVCENNFYAIHSHHLKRHHSDNICERAKAYGMPAQRIKDQDIFKIYEQAKGFVKKIRQGRGPAFLECLTCRWKEHVGPNDDFDLGYRSIEEVACWRRTDQLERLRKILSPKVIQKIESGVDREIKQAIEFAQTSPVPKRSALYQDVFKER